MMPFTPPLQIAPEVEDALANGQPVVALETTIVAHGLPRPQNLECARRSEAVIRDEGAVPATIGIIDGVLHIGLNDDQLMTLALGENVRKVSRRDFGIVLARKGHGATTVAGTMIGAHLAGIRVFATGGIGGVHRGDADDVSADLPELAMTPVVVVSAGAKVILDLPRTLEYLETAGVPVLGWQTDEFPAFYTIHSGLPVDARVESGEDAAAIIAHRWGLGLEGGVLVAVPPPADLALPADDLEAAVQTALGEAEAQGITGKTLTPFLLGRISTLTEGRSTTVNLALVEKNARIASQIAAALTAYRP